MNSGSTTLLVQLSNAITAQVTAASRLLVAIRTGPNRHISGLIWRSDLVLTSDQALPVRDGYTLALPDGTLRAAKEVGRDPAGNIALLKLDRAAASVAIRPPIEAVVGAFVLVLAADATARPLARAGIIHRVPPGRGDDSGEPDRLLTLDLPFRLIEEGGPVLDATGGLLGMALCGAEGEAMVVRYAILANMVAETSGTEASGLDEPHDGLPDPDRPWSDHMPEAISPRAWLGVALRPMPVPVDLRADAGARLGRMILSLSPNGPADLAGLEPGDLLLSLDGVSIGGPNTLRRFLSPDRVGRRVMVRLVRSGAILTVGLTVEAEPAGAA
jgi:S1-C subfamily serine protease